MSDENTHILVVEDTASLLHIYETYLKKRGYDVTSVLTAHDALNYISNNSTDLILLDLKLPDMDGLDVMAELKARNFTAPVIIITGHGSINTAITAMRHGAWDLLVKPFNVDRLGEAVAKGLEGGHVKTAPGTEPDTEYDAVVEAAGTRAAEAPDRPLQDKNNPRTRSEDSARKAENPSAPKISTAHEDRQGDHERKYGSFIGTSPVMRDLYKQIDNAAKSHAPVFITGESGTGKEVCAEAIHKNSARAHKPFVPINCAAIPKDLIESELFGHVKGAFTGAMYDRDGAAKVADGGTLFLDEIGEMDVSMQTKLLRFLQNYTFQKVGDSRLERTDVRIICATNRDPHSEIRQGRFRDDLFYRLYVIPVHLPPLCQRDQDIAEIACSLLLKYAREENKSFRQFSADAEDCLLSYHWPGNIRELQNIIRNIVVMNKGDTVTVNMLPEHLKAMEEHERNIKPTPLLPEKTDRLSLTTHNVSPDYGLGALAGDMEHNPTNDSTWFDHPAPGTSPVKPLWLVEKEAIESAIRECRGNIPKAAALLEVAPSTLYRKKQSWAKENNNRGNEV